MTTRERQEVVCARGGAGGWGHSSVQVQRAVAWEVCCGVVVWEGGGGDDWGGVGVIIGGDYPPPLPPLCPLKSISAGGSRSDSAVRFPTPIRIVFQGNALAIGHGCGGSLGSQSKQPPPPPPSTSLGVIGTLFCRISRSCPGWSWPTARELTAVLAPGPLLAVAHQGQTWACKRGTRQGVSAAAVENGQQVVGAVPCNLVP